MSLLDKLRKKDTPKGAGLEQKNSSAAPKKAAAKKDAEGKSSSTAVASKGTGKGAITLDTVLVRPVVTEKATLTGTYIFEVRSDANKSEVKKAIQKIYGVTPVQIGIMNVQGKTTNWNRTQGKRKDWKKAIIRLKAGETINVYEGV